MKHPWYLGDDLKEANPKSPTPSITETPSEEKEVIQKALEFETPVSVSLILHGRKIPFFR